MRILITGGAGFIGHHLIEYFLTNTNHQIVSLDRLDTSGNLNRLTDLKCWTKEKTRVKIIHHDLKAEFNPFIIKSIGHIDIILHLAASSHVDRSIADPMSFVMDNVVGTVNVLNYARLNSTPLLYFSTDEVFGPAPEGKLYSENDRYNSGNPYAASKAAAEEFVVAYHNTYKLPVLITHTMNVFGERQHPEKFLPTIVREINEGGLVKIHADMHTLKPGSRFYLHANNVASAINFLLGYKFNGEKYNIVGEQEVDNRKMAALVSAIMEKHLIYRLVDFHSSRPGHDLRYALDGSKLARMGFKFPNSFELSLEKTVKWYMQHPNWL